MKNTRIRASARDVFWHVLAMATLYVSASSLSVVLFQLINIAIPDELGATLYYGYDQAEQYRSVLRSGLSFLLIFFPVCLYAFSRLNTLYRQKKETTSLGVRRAIIYFTLFVVSLIIMFTLVFLVNQFFDGEITLRFILKSISTLLVAGTIFGYYRWDLKRF